MTVELRTHAAIERAEAERERAERTAEAFDEFGRRVEDVPTDGNRRAGGRAQGGPTAGSGPTGGGALAVGTTASAGGAESVREAFRETVLPHADADNVADALADELSRDLAAALSPAAGGFTAPVQAQLASRIEERCRECRLLAAAIDAERDRLREVGEELDAITDWLAEADETPLLQLDFEQLRARHDRLDEFRETCDRLARERQQALDGTQRDGLTGIRERELRGHLYADFADDHPVLADVARLDAALADCQQAVREHLCARV